MANSIEITQAGNHFIGIQRFRRRWMLPAAVAIAAAAASNLVTASTLDAAAVQNRVAELQVVDCLLPGVVRKLGKTQYLTPRRPIHTTAADCNIRGGEYTSYDRADYKTALAVWMPSAKDGDAEAQVNVGEIFERGLGDQPNYEAAAIWYQKAAEQGNTRAQFNLGTLYEQGLGVEKDRLMALNLYRQAWGIADDDVIYQSAANAEMEQLRKQLAQQVSIRESRINKLEQDLQNLQNKLNEQKQSANKQSAVSEQDQEALEMEVASLKEWIASLEKEQQQNQQQLADMPALREPTVPAANVSNVTPSGPEISADGMEFGRYYALVIGNKEYSFIDKLSTPENDAKQLAEVLEGQYGFTVELLLNANNIEVMEAINNLKGKLTENDNLLIYYAGHGNRVQAGKVETGYWLPVNADAPPRDTYWVANEFITRHLNRLDAKRVLVIADSCYGGLLSDAPGYLMFGDQQKTPEFLKYKLPKKSRLLLSSGGDKPVMDKGAPEHSVFAAVLIDTLKNNEGVMTGPELFSKINKRVAENAKANDFDQQPEFKVIKGAGHEVGDFFFVPSKT